MEWEGAGYQWLQWWKRRRCIWNQYCQGRSIVKHWRSNNYLLRGHTRETTYIFRLGGALMEFDGLRLLSSLRNISLFLQRIFYFSILNDHCENSPKLTQHIHFKTGDLHCTVELISVFMANI
mmetsp:Transcript_43372/g.101759  ORF Transcript_43372/g.101759 Transcript_43372/m.101759 type:complete len:122 (-) Transcript_43372:207-572(-)